jgi:hypothetical protein
LCEAPKVAAYLRGRGRPLHLLLLPLILLILIIRPLHGDMGVTEMQPRGLTVVTGQDDLGLTWGLLGLTGGSCSCFPGINCFPGNFMPVLDDPKG